MAPNAAEKVADKVADKAGAAVDAAVDGAKKIRRWSEFSYTTRVTLSFALVAFMTAVVALSVLSFVWEKHFQEYTRENMQSTATTTAQKIGAKYEETHRWSPETTSTAAYVAITYPGIGIAVYDETGRTVFDSSRTAKTDTYPSEADAVSLAPRSDDQVARSPIMADGRTVGEVRVWVYGSDTLLRQADREFRTNSYTAMLWASLLAIVLASAIGYMFARNLVSPIKKISKTAREIKEGNLSARTGLQGEDEISRLGETFDEMAESVEKDRMLERRLTSDVAHELRTPLMAIQATVEAMVDGVFEADEERLETVNNEVQRLSRLVDAILKLSRLENRSKPLNMQLLDVSELISGIIATHDAFVTDSGLDLHFSSDDDVFIMGDADMIRQATANLISNAVRYTPEGGSITVSVTKGLLMANIAVEDTGIGLTPEEAKMVFSRFWRADAGRNRESGGLGIGLSIVKEIVDRHNGWVQVEGKPGEGARFTIHIPLAEEPKLSSKEEKKKKEEQRKRDQQRKKEEHRRQEEKKKAEASRRKENAKKSDAAKQEGGKQSESKSSGSKPGGRKQGSGKQAGKQAPKQAGSKQGSDKQSGGKQGSRLRLKMDRKQIPGASKLAALVPSNSASKSAPPVERVLVESDGAEVDAAKALDASAAEGTLSDVPMVDLRVEETE